MPDDTQGILTGTQRAYLRGESQIERGSSHERAIRSRIRTRLYNSIFDLALLQASLEPRDIEQAFKKNDGSFQAATPRTTRGESEKDHPRIFNQFGKVLGLFFDGTARASKYRDSDIGYDEVDTEEIIEMFEDIVEDGVTKMFLRRGVTVNDVFVNIGVELGPRLTDVSTDDLSNFSEHELKQLLETGTISPEKYGTEIMQRQGS